MPACGFTARSNDTESCEVELDIFLREDVCLWWLAVCLAFFSLAMSKPALLFDVNLLWMMLAVLPAPVLCALLNEGENAPQRQRIGFSSFQIFSSHNLLVKRVACPERAAAKLFASVEGRLTVFGIGFDGNLAFFPRIRTEAPVGFDTRRVQV